MHALATVICYDVLEDVQCPSPSMKCCIEGPVDNKESEKRPATTRRPATTTTTTTTTTTEKPDNDDDDEEEDEKEVSSSSSDSKNKACPGVCVADRIAEYCEAYLTTSGLCKSGSKCCVSRDIYPDKPPADLHIPSEFSRYELSC